MTVIVDLQLRQLWRGGGNKRLLCVKVSTFVREGRNINIARDKFKSELVIEPWNSNYLD